VVDDHLLTEVLERLDRDSKISGLLAEELVLGALLGRLAEVLEGDGVCRPAAEAHDDRAAVRAYLESIAVTGFRGIGPRCELRLRPGPGLTLVVGRNGSGKSSLAEAAEFALTEDALRWSGKSGEWRGGWRNLHVSEDALIELGLRVDGERDPVTVRVGWAGPELESATTSVTVPGRGRHSLDTLGWASAVRTFRPFLSYSELSKIIEGRPVDRYNALAPMLGMEALQRPIEELRQARLASEKQLAAAERDVAATLRVLGQSKDDRAGTAAEALRGTWDLATIESLIAGTEPRAAERERILAALSQLPAPDIDRSIEAASRLRQAEERLTALRGTDAERAHTLADLLQAAVAVHDRHGDSDCPVCGRAAGLDARRVEVLRQEIDRLQAEGRAVTSARRAADQARVAALDAIGAAPHILGVVTGEELGLDLAEVKEAWARWLDPPDSTEELAAHLESTVLDVADATSTVRSTAARRQEELADQWRPLAEQLGELLPVARQGVQARQQMAPLKQAERWLKACEAEIRDERFEAVKAQVKSVWDELAVGSNVTLEDVRLGTKKVDMDVTVDGDRSAALGVMSQGELHALALSLFIPRVKGDDSPFGFALLDDPVQAMDPIRVDGLARVLHDLARTRQVVVFTHDDRLPSAIRRLQFPATVLTVTRRPRSAVELRPTADPLHAAIADARALLLSDGLPNVVARRVIPGLCRQAIEAACIDAGWRKLLGAGLSHAECEEAFVAAAKLLPRIALALYGDAERAGDVYTTLKNMFGPSAADTARDCNEMAHRGAGPGVDLRNLIDRSKSLAEKLAAL
jgi:predicted ATPase